MLDKEDTILPFRDTSTYKKSLRTQLLTYSLPNRSSSDIDTIDMITKICHDVIPVYGSSTTDPFLIVGAVLLEFNLSFTSCRPSSTKCRLIDFLPVHQP